MTERQFPAVLAIIPIRGLDLARTGGMPTLGGRPLAAYTIEAAKAAQSVQRIVVSTDSEEVRQLVLGLGAEAPFLRPPALAEAGVPIEQVLKHCLSWLEERERFSCDVIVRLEISHPFREPRLIDQVVQVLVERKLDTVFTAFEEHHDFWKMDQYGELAPIEKEHHTRAGRTPIFKEMSGLVCASRAELIKTGRRLGQRVGLVPLRSLHALVDTQDDMGMDLAQQLIDS